jgi:hypothetical protein
MTDNRIRVARATDPERYLATDHTVWFSEVPAAPTEEQLIGLPEEQGTHVSALHASEPANLRPPRVTVSRPRSWR